MSFSPHCRRRPWTALCPVVIALALAWPSAAKADPVTIEGQIKGGEQLLNPVWNEAKDPKSHRYTFRAPSATVGKRSKVLAAYLPKELCIVALQQTPVEPKKVPVRMTVSGGRTTPVTLVVTQGQPVQIENHDPFPHRLYDVGKIAHGLGAADIEPDKSRTWTPPGPGKYELRDTTSPSLRSWIVVEPRAVTVAFPDRKGAFRMEIEPGRYQLRAYFSGEPTGVMLPIEAKPGPGEQKLPVPLVVKEGSKSKEPKKGD